MLGVFFGSFDPIHENHISVCQAALASGCQQVCVVANGDNPLKPSISDVLKRQVLIQTRLDALEKATQADPEDSRMQRCTKNIFQYCCSDDERKHMNWSDRFYLCEKLARIYGYYMEGDSNTRDKKGSRKICLPHVIQLVGEDSFLQSYSNVGNNISFAHGRRLMVFPRSAREVATTTSERPNSLRKILSDHPELGHRITLLSDFVEVVPCLSSTGLRQDIAAWWQKSKGVGELHLIGLDASVCQKVVELNLYNPLLAFIRFHQRLPKTSKAIAEVSRPNAKNAKSCRIQSFPIIFFTGRPGCGKSSNAARLAAEFDLLYFNGGDSFRQLQTENPGRRISKPEATTHVLAQMSHTVQQSLLQNRGLILDCQPREDSDIHAERGVLASQGLRINLLLNLTCSEEIAAARICTRQRSQEDTSRKRKRETFAFEDVVIKFQEPGRKCGCIVDVNTESDDKDSIYKIIRSRVRVLVRSTNFDDGFLPPATSITNTRVSVTM